MIQKLQKFFNTEKWWGRVLLIFLLYIAYIILGYILIPLLISILQGFNFGGFFIFLYLFVIAPALSYFIPIGILKILKINKTLLYVIHTILVVLIPFVFLWMIIHEAFNNFGSF